MNYTEQTLEAERFGLLNSLDKGEVLSWITSPNYGREEREWDEEV